MVQNTNNVLNKARKDKKDEFYTQYSDIEEELSAYLDLNPSLFQDKTVFCPCDNPEWSNFTKYFLINFKKLGLKKLISVGYATECLNMGFDFSKKDFSIDKNAYNGKVLIATESNIDAINADNPQWEYLKGTGDFRNEESRAFRDEADFIVTNPPFSLFREFINWIFESGKSFLVVGNLNAAATKEMFGYIKGNRMWFGKGFKGLVGYFISNYEDYTKNRIKQEGMIRVPSVVWFTNIDLAKRHSKLEINTMAYNLENNKKISEYAKYDNFDALEISSTNAIPSDYDELMGVPITFLDKYCPEQFEIVDLRHDLKLNGKLMYARVMIKKTAL